MKKYITLFFLMLTLTDIAAQSPKWSQKARASQVTIVSYSEDGQMKQNQGVLIDSKGTVITEYDFLKGAVKAIAIDCNGKELAVSRISGASSMYNVAKLQVELGKAKIKPLTLSVSPAELSSVVYVLPTTKADKKALCQIDTIKNIETFKEEFSYYTLSKPLNERLSNAPVLNSSGELIGLVQLAAKEGKPSFVMDARFVEKLCISALDAANADLKAINIRKALPETAEEALTYLYLLGQKDKDLYKEYIEDFITLHPENTSGYTMKAELAAEQGNYGKADSTYQKALQMQGIKKDEIFYSLSQSIYHANMSTSYTQFQDWHLERALREAGNAYAENPLPIYTHQEANCLYATKKYEEAALKFLALTETNLRSPEMFMYAAQCHQMAGKESSEVIALMDSALACYPKPYPLTAANTIIVRAKALAEAGRNKEAVIGYNDFEHLSPNGLTANFYYEREQLEVKCRMYPAALNDIDKAIKLSPKEAILYAEGAALNYRVGQVDDAAVYAQKAIDIDADFADAHRILGVCLIQKEQKEEARKHLQKAIELGDELAKGVLEKLE